MKVFPLDETLHEIDVYVIVSQISKEFYVWKCQSGRLYENYKAHAAGRSNSTKDLFARSDEEALFPKMYFLETVQTTEQLAFRHCIAWTKYFTEHGFETLACDTIVAYTGDMVEYTQGVYDRINSLPIDAVLADEKCVVKQYKRRGESKSKRDRLTVYLDPKEYDEIEKKAKKMGLSMNRYARNMVLDGCLIYMDAPPIWEVTTKIRETNIILKQILYAIYQNGKYYPTDLGNIQKMVDRIVKVEDEIDDIFEKFIDEIIKFRKSMKGDSPIVLHPPRD